MASNASRPILITIIAILEFLAGILVLLAGIVLIAGMIPVSELPAEIQSFGSAAGIACIVLGLIYIVIAGGFWNGWSIMWYIGVIVNVLSVILSIVAMATAGISAGAIVGIIINLLILYYLFRPGVKNFFGI